jgi:NADPH-dependent 2,4-dienoyl-CoA reductase/sulfur reductase-like enzyme
VSQLRGMTYGNLLKNGEVVHGTVEQVTDTQVRLTDGREIPFDYAVICTGAVYRGMIKCTHARRAHAWALWRRRVLTPWCWCL